MVDLLRVIAQALVSLLETYIAPLGSLQQQGWRLLVLSGGLQMVVPCSQCPIDAAGYPDGWLRFACGFVSLAGTTWSLELGVPAAAGCHW